MIHNGRRVCYPKSGCVGTYDSGDSSCGSTAPDTVTETEVETMTTTTATYRYHSYYYTTYYWSV